jgi:hypothetical protein
MSDSFTECGDSVLSLPQYTATLLDPCVASRALTVEATNAVRSARIDFCDIFDMGEEIRSNCDIPEEDGNDS